MRACTRVNGKIQKVCTSEILALGHPDASVLGHPRLLRHAPSPYRALSLRWHLRLLPTPIPCARTPACGCAP
jgi:hypothetical protein